MARIIIFGASGGCCGGPWCQRKWRGTNPCATFVPPLCWSYWHRRTWYVTSASLPWLNRVDEDGNKEPQNDSMVGMKKILNMISSQWQEHFPLDQDTQSPAQPCLEHFEGWGALQDTLVSFRSLEILGFHGEDIPQMSRTPRPWAEQLWLLPSHALPLCPAVVAHCCCHWSLYRDSRLWFPGHSSCSRMSFSASSVLWESFSPAHLTALTCSNKSGCPGTCWHRDISCPSSPNPGCFPPLIH